MKTYQKLSLVLALGFSAAANSSVTPVVLYGLDTGSNSALATPGWIANAFNTGANCTTGCTLGDISLELAGTFFSGGSISGVTLQLYSDNNAGIPGPSAIGHAYINPPSVSTTAGINLFQPNPLDNGLNLLFSNHTYWVKLDASALGAADISWYYSDNPNSTGQWAFDSFTGGSGHGTTQPFAMQVLAGGSPVPVPAAGWLMGSVLIGLVSSWRKKTAG
ncbi:MAG: hypothetical protein QX198_05845 [Methylococcaceae bacterium]